MKKVRYWLDIFRYNRKFTIDIFKIYFEYIKSLYPLSESRLKSIVRANKIKYLS